MKGRYATAGIEPPVEEIIADPVMQFILRRDRLTAADVWAAVELARRALRQRRLLSC